jgi:hypothetical protein
MAEDVEWEAYVTAARRDERDFPFLVPVLNHHLNERRHDARVHQPLRP